MNLTFTLNGKSVSADISPDTLLLDLVRHLGCKSVKRGCGTGNCGLCTVYLDGKTMQERARLLISVAHPSAREELDRAAFERWGSHHHYIKGYMG